MTTRAVQVLTTFAVITLFFFSFLPVSVGQENQESLPNPTPTPTPFPESQKLQPVPFANDDQISAAAQTGALTEVVERRTATSKHYQLAPNFYRADISSIPIHYQDTNGKWQEIDMQPVVRPEGGFKVEANNVKLVFPEKLRTGLDVAAIIYPPQAEQRQFATSNQTKPDLATLFKGDSTVGKAPQSLPLRLSLQWQPQYLAYATATGPATAFFQFDEMSAKIVKDSVEYAQASENIILSFQSTATGFVQRLHFTAPPTEAAFSSADATMLEYRIFLKLPSNVQLYAQGVRQTDNFKTPLLELRDEAGNSLITLSAPQWQDQKILRTSPQTQYRVERLPEGIALIAELPLDWLTDPSRQYPAIAEFSVIVPLAFITQSMPFFQDTWIYECLPNGPVNTEVMWAGSFINPGCTNAGVERTLVQWTVNSLPPNAVIVNPTESQLWRLPTSDTGGGTEVIGTHRLLVPWNFASATWLNRATSTPWTQPGAENDYLTSLESSVNVSTGGSPIYISMGSLASVVGAWHTNQYFSPWGDPNFGVLYKSATESIPNLDRAFAQIGFNSGSNPPLLSVTYADPPLSAFVTPLDPDTNYFTPRAPSPDYFQINNISKWRAFGVRPLDGRSDYDLFLSTSQNFTASIVAQSFSSGSVPDFVVINPNVSTTLYPGAIQWEGTGLYYLRYATHSGVLDLGGTTLINDTAFTFTVLSVYQANLTAGQNYQITLDVNSGNADLGLALFPPTAAGGANFMTRDQAAKLSDLPNFGGDEEITYSPQVSGQYGLVVWNNGGTQNSTYQLRLLSAIKKTFLPTILKNFTPPLPAFANGGFETGAFSPWVDSDLSGPMVANVVGNPAPGCFSGSFTARLGTPGQQPNNSIPVGEVNFSQQFSVPPGTSQLIFRYQVFSYDIIQGSSSSRPYDRFEVTINGNPVLVSGNPAGSSNGQTLWQSGCQTGTINISSFAGQGITLKFSLYNLTFPSYNTWAYVDDVLIQ